MSKQSNIQPSRFSGDWVKSHLAFLFGQFNVEELRDVQHALSDLIDEEQKQVTERAENTEAMATA